MCRRKSRPYLDLVELVILVLKSHGTLDLQGTGGAGNSRVLLRGLDFEGLGFLASFLYLSPRATSPQSKPEFEAKLFPYLFEHQVPPLRRQSSPLRQRWLSPPVALSVPKRASQRLRDLASELVSPVLDQ